MILINCGNWVIRVKTLGMAMFIGACIAMLAMPGYADSPPSAQNVQDAQLSQKSQSSQSSQTVPSSTENFKLKETAAPDSTSSPSAGKMLGALASILALIVVMAWAAKRLRLGPMQPMGTLKLESMLTVGQREKIAIVNAEGKRFLVGITPQGISLISDMGAEKQPELPAENFARDLRDAVLKKTIIKGKDHA